METAEAKIQTIERLICSGIPLPLMAIAIMAVVFPDSAKEFSGSLNAS